MEPKTPYLAAGLALAVMISCQASASSNPVLKQMEKVHQLADSNSRHSGDLTGDGKQETVRRGSSRGLLHIVDSRGRGLGDIRLGDAVDGFAVDDIDRDGQAEVIVLTHELHRLRAFDASGQQIPSLDEPLLRQARGMYEQSILVALDELATAAMHDPQAGGVPDADELGVDAASCLQFLAQGETPLYWNEADFDALTGLPLIKGTVGADVIIGTNGSDVIVGGGGSDVICGLGGDDWIYGDFQNFHGLTANDDLVSYGLDYLYGGDGEDNLFGGPITDVLSGGNGNDSMFGGLQRDFLFGDLVFQDFAQNVPILYGVGVDFLVGMEGNDSVEGNAANDVVNAVAFDDVTDETEFMMNTHPVDQDRCYVHPTPEAFWAQLSGCENVVVTDW